MKNNKWSPLKKGDIVDVIAPGWATDHKALKKAEKFLKSWGLKARFPKSIYQPHFLGSNTSSKRFSHFQAALKKKDSKVIWCLRGGYGSLHLLPYLQKMKKPKNSKLLIGISDITSLHSFLVSNWGWPTLHGPLLDRVANGKLLKKHELEFKKLIFGELPILEFKKLKALNPAARKNKKIRAQVVGGNLTVFQSLIGTKSYTKLKNKILFIEDIGERAYRIDRELEHLLQIGELNQVKALIFGEFMGVDETDGKNHMNKLMQIWAGRLKAPVLKGLEAGHGLVQRPIFLGTNAELQLGKKIIL